MSYIVNDGPDRGRNRRPLLLAVAVIVVIALAVGAYFMGRGDGAGGAASRGSGSPTLPGLGEPAVTWSLVGDQPVPRSAVHGPRQTSNGLASGFTHDELGAVLAAINISTRLSSSAGPALYEATARQQCVGDIAGTIATLRSQYSASAPGESTPTEFFYRVDGDPTGAVVVVSFAASSPQATAMGGYAQVTRTLQWIGGDWKVQVPPNPPQLIGSTDGYTPLGRTHA